MARPNPPKRKIATKRILDAFSGAGGTGMGYHMAGFDVVGVDKERQDNYPFQHIVNDFLKLDPDWLRANFDSIHASPPCQKYTDLNTLWNRDEGAADLITVTRDLLKATGLPYVIENVPGAWRELQDPVVLCGSSFGLRVRRHRLFEIKGFTLPELQCDHDWQDRHAIYPRRAFKEPGSIQMSGTVGVFGTTHMIGVPSEKELRLVSVAMGIDWMTKDELNQAIPPAYTRYIGEALMKSLQ